SWKIRLACPLAVLALVALSATAQMREEKRYLGPLSLDVPHVSKDPSVKLDYPIVYVRAPRRDPTGPSKWAEAGDPRAMEPGSVLIVIYPDGKENVLVPVEPHESIADPFVSFDAAWVYYAKFHDVKKHRGSDIYKVHVATRKTVRLTQQVFTPNT